jgi:hypothetical protein
MQTVLETDILKKITFLIGTVQILEQAKISPVRPLFDEKVVSFLDDVSKEIMRDREARAYSDVITFAFWIRKASVLKLKERFAAKDDMVRMGKGVIFHISPSNVPINFAYSLVSGLLTGNVNVVRVPSKTYQQVKIVTSAINRVLETYPEMRLFIICIQYVKDRSVNDFLSAMCDLRIVWGGNQTIADLRKSPLSPRSGEITFADRYSLAVIDSDRYISIDNKEKVAEDFYNDTFVSDQNACTSPRIVIWMGKHIEEAKQVFWKTEHEYAKERYHFQSIQGINKLMACCTVAVAIPDAKVLPHTDNLIVRVQVQELAESLMEYRDNSGYFYEYDCKDILELWPLCNDKRCQTIAYLGDKELFQPLLRSGVKGIARIVPMGKTMDFDLVWDGNQLPSMMTRTIAVM